MDNAQIGDASFTWICTWSASTQRRKIGPLDICQSIFSLDVSDNKSYTNYLCFNISLRYFGIVEVEQRVKDGIFDLAMFMATMPSAAIPLIMKLS